MAAAIGLRTEAEVQSSKDVTLNLKDFGQKFTWRLDEFKKLDVNFGRLCKKKPIIRSVQVKGSAVECACITTLIARFFNDFHWRVLIFFPYTVAQVTGSQCCIYCDISGDGEVAIPSEDILKCLRSTFNIGSDTKWHGSLVTFLFLYNGIAQKQSKRFANKTSNIDEFCASVLAI